MGFVSGFTGGVTVTLGVAYLTVLAHERNRQTQALYLRSQSQLLNSLLEPNPLPPSPSRAAIVRESRSTLVDNAKGRWNNEIENAVRWVQHKDWNNVRESMEATVARLLGGGLQKSREGIEYTEHRAGPIIQDARERASVSAKAGADRAYTSANEGLDYARTKTTELASTAKSETKTLLAEVRVGAGEAAVRAQELASATKFRTDKALTDATASANHAGERVQGLASATREKAEKTAENAKVNAKDVAHSSKTALNSGVEKGKEVANIATREAVTTGAGTVDAARGAVRGAISKGVAKGRELVGKAQEVVGMVSEQVESQIHSTGFRLSEEEKALRQRYEKSNEMAKSVEQALVERYTPIDQRDNTVLRGV